MKNGIDRFEFWLLKIETLFVEAAAEKNPGLWLYTNDIRTPLFMLEGLAKMYAGIHNKNRFGKLKEDFKLLEDALGVIDYYDSFAKEFAKEPRIPITVTEYIQAQTREKIQRLNDILQERGWIGEFAERIKTIRKKLKGADWLKDEKEIKCMEDFYKASIKEINIFFAETNGKFTEIETQVHELRRKLRWLSIYPKALQGSIQLTDSHISEEHLSRYLTEDVISSPFNKMPDAGINRYFLMLERNYFLSLSWMISEMGKLKDSGLRVIVVTEAFQQTKGINKPEAQALAYQVLGDQQPTLISILSESFAMTQTYFKEQNLERLIAGITKID
ncbi:hypothetical protein BH11BAC4_BH11BAC4_03030 [soil metagenome]